MAAPHSLDILCALREKTIKTKGTTSMTNTMDMLRTAINLLTIASIIWNVEAMVRKRKRATVSNMCMLAMLNIFAVVTILDGCAWGLTMLLLSAITIQGMNVGVLLARRHHQDQPDNNTEK